MEHITQDQTAAQDQTGTPPARVTPRPGRLRRRLVPALVGGGMAFVLALWLTSAFVLGVGKVWAGRTEAGELLHRIALVAASSTDIPPLDQIRDDQYVYIETYREEVRWACPEEGPDGSQVFPSRFVPLEPFHRQVWLSVDGSRSGLLRDPLHDNTKLEGVTEPSLHDPHLRYLATLPTNPDLLLLKIYWENGDMGPNPQQEAFVTIGDLIREQVVPPDVAQALYEAAARIPGIEVIDEAEDALGRRGIAIARTHNGIRRELIFDSTTLEFLGEREVIVGPVDLPIPEGGAAPDPQSLVGTVLSSTAVVARAIVDAPGQVPGE